ncbi:MAG: helix-turn-helix domain-containing protein [Oscillospiraceae bacterium]
MISKELRELIITDRREGLSVAEIGRVLHVGKPTIWKLLKQERETGSIESRCHGRKSSLTAEQYEQMIALVEAESDVTLEEIRERLRLPIHKSQIGICCARPDTR